MKLFLILACLVNVLAMVGVQFYYRTGRLKGVQFVLKRVDNASKDRMNYLIAGCANQPKMAFRLLTDAMTSGGITHVNYTSIGHSPKAMAREVMREIQRRHCEATIYAVSIGDQVARYLEEMLGDEIEVIAINPCPQPRALRWHKRLLGMVSGPILQVLKYALGLLSLIPLTPAGYSISLIADQIWAAAYIAAPQNCKQTKGVVRSLQDEFLRGEWMNDFYPAEIIDIEATHADVIRRASEYRMAITQILR